VKNPIGLKCGPSLNLDEMMKLIDILNPENQPGRLTLISRMGHDKIAEYFPKMVQRVRAEGRNVVWCCDPMHGNTMSAKNGYKTRAFGNILSEVRQFFDIHQSIGSIAGGVHFELTGKDVVECIGGDQEISEENLAEGHYETLCDPRLNASQALQLCR
jgi:3-deoxy-7-phosphoheptulonate synthase